MTPRILIVGASAAPELAELLDACQNRWRAMHVDSLGEAAAPLSEEPGFLLVVLAQSRPGQFANAELLRLQLATPLTRWVVLLGPWCEGEMQTGRPLPGAARIYWRERRRVIRLLERYSDRLQTELSLPATATTSERIEQNTSEPPPRPAVDLVGVVTREKTTFNSLADACRVGGCSTIWLLPDEPPPTLRTVGAYLWDFTRGDYLEFQQVRDFTRQAKSAPIIGLLGFPRQQDFTAMAELGLVDIIGKPYFINELLAALVAAAGKTPSQVA